MQAEGTILNILRGSLYDGPGVRTTVFLKGCPLRCLWCHNPEGIAFPPQLGYLAHRCIGCKRCEAVCPAGVHRFDDDNHIVDFARCITCGKCVDVCPAQALEIYGKAMTVDEVMRTVLKDMHFYQYGDGGITLSGGEPLAQPAFTEALLRAAKKNNVHTCVETCGYVKQEDFQRILSCTDLFLFDYKADTPERHLAFTGRDNALILGNLDFLYHAGAELILRCPVIPGFNDTPGHFQAILAMKRKYPRLHGIEIMPYHDLGASKAAWIGQPYPLSISTVGREQKEQWRRQLGKDSGIIIN